MHNELPTVQTSFEAADYLDQLDYLRRMKVLT